MLRAVAATSTKCRPEKPRCKRCESGPASASHGRRGRRTIRPKSRKAAAFVAFAGDRLVPRRRRGAGTLLGAPGVGGVGGGGRGTASPLGGPAHPSSQGGGCRRNRAARGGV